MVVTDGVFGFAFKEVSLTDQRSTPIDNLYEQGKIKSRLSCIKLNEIGEETGGELIIGGCDVEAEYWVPISNNGFWQVNITKVEVKTPSGEIKATFCNHPHHTCVAVLDTGADDISKIVRLSKQNMKNLEIWFEMVFNQVHHYILSTQLPKRMVLH